MAGSVVVVGCGGESQLCTELLAFTGLLLELLDFFLEFRVLLLLALDFHFLLINQLLKLLAVDLEFLALQIRFR